MPRKGQAGTAARGQLTPPKPLTARRKDEGSRWGTCPQGPEGRGLRVSGSGHQRVLTSSALEPAGPSCAVHKE